MDLAPLLRFSELLGEFSRIERKIYIPGTDRRENDVEHSFHLAMITWYLIDSTSLDLDLSRAFRYALAHDLVEIYAGDTDFYSNDEAHVTSKPAREAAAAARLREEYPEFPQVHEAIDAYVRKDDRESRFVYALDKILPILRNRENGGREWREKGITLEMLVKRKDGKVAISPEVQPYYDELVALLRKEDIMAK